MAEIKNAYPPFRNPYKQKGRPLHHTPEELSAEFEKYVKWCLDNPIVISKTISKTPRSTEGGTAVDIDEVETKPRLIGIGGFLVWLGEDEKWWEKLDKGSTYAEEFFGVKSRIRVYCEDYQKAMASNGVFKENIISRLLGLADKKAVSTEGVTIVVESPEQKDKMENIGNLGV